MCNFNDGKWVRYYLNDGNFSLYFPYGSVDTDNQ